MFYQFAPLLQSNANRIYTFSRIGDAKLTGFQNSQVVKRQQVEEFARRLIFPISQAAVAVSKKIFLVYKLFEVSQDSFLTHRYYYINVHIYVICLDTRSSESALVTSP